ncbi:MAG: hypothetical protein U1F25_15925 [Rubrivivax sp.]
MKLFSEAGRFSVSVVTAPWRVTSSGASAAPAVPGEAVVWVTLSPCVVRRTVPNPGAEGMARCSPLRACPPLFDRSVGKFYAARRSRFKRA